MRPECSSSPRAVVAHDSQHNKLDGCKNIHYSIRPRSQPPQANFHSITRTPQRQARRLQASRGLVKEQGLHILILPSGKNRHGQAQHFRRRSGRGLAAHRNLTRRDFPATVHKAPRPHPCSYMQLHVPQRRPIGRGILAKRIGHEATPQASESPPGLRKTMDSGRRLECTSTGINQHRLYSQNWRSSQSTATQHLRNGQGQQH